MSTNKEMRYFKVDINVITFFDTIDYPVYVAANDKKSMSLLFDKGTAIDRGNIAKLKLVKNLYVHDSHKDLYDLDHEEYLEALEQSQQVSIEKKAALMYEKAAESLNAIFNNPESFENVQLAKDTVNGFMDVISSSDNAMESLFKVTTLDYDTYTHSINTSVYALCIGDHINLSLKEMEALGTAALLHDLGKSKIHPSTLYKKGKLTLQEYRNVKLHSSISYDIALKMGIKDKNVLYGIRHHHERIDGTGYPDKIMGNEISKIAKIIAVSDVFDAMTTNRSYKPTYTTFEALKIIKTEMQSHLDPTIVNNMISMFRGINK